MTDMPSLTIRGRRIKIHDGLVCLNDIHSAAGFTKTRRPNDWWSLGITKQLYAKTLERITGKRSNWSKSEMRSVFYSKVGQGGGTFVHPILAVSFAEFLNPDIAYEVREVFLRFRAADPTLADEVLERASPEANEWAGKRALGRVERRRFTDTLKAHGVVGRGYGEITNAMYQRLFDANAAQLRARAGVKKSIPLRDSMSTDEIIFVAASESLARERIGDENAQGNAECKDASERSAGFIRQAIEADRADRRKRRIL